MANKVTNETIEQVIDAEIKNTQPNEEPEKKETSTTEVVKPSSRERRGKKLKIIASAIGVAAAAGLTAAKVVTSFVKKKYSDGYSDGYDECFKENFVETPNEEPEQPVDEPTTEEE